MNTRIRVLLGFRSRKTAFDTISYPICESVPIRNTRIKTNKQREHIKGEHYRDGASYFKENMTEEEIYKLIVDNVGEGIGKRLNDNSIREMIKLDKVIGIGINKEGRREISHTLLIHYSNNGIHAYPIIDDENRLF